MTADAAPPVLPSEDESDPSGMLSAARADPIGGYALFLLNVIDTKVAALFTVIGILIAALLLFHGQPELYAGAAAAEPMLKTLAAASLGMAVSAAFLSLSCLNLIHISRLGGGKQDPAIVVARLDQIARSRRRRYLAALTLTAAALLAAALLTFFLIW